MTIRKIINTVFAVTIAIFAHSATAFDEADVENSFFPYKSSTPEFPGYEAGMVIDQNNVDQFEAILDPGMYDHLKNGRFEMRTAPRDRWRYTRTIFKRPATQ